MGRISNTVKELRELLATTTDRKEKLRITGQLAKIEPRPRAAIGRPRTKPPKPAAAPDLLLGARILDRAVAVLEKLRKAGPPAPTEAERRAAVKVLEDGLNSHERASYEAFRQSDNLRRSEKIAKRNTLRVAAGKPELTSRNKPDGSFEKGRSDL